MLNSLIPIIPIAPLIGFLLLALSGKLLPKSISGILASAFVLVSFVLGLILFFQIQNQPGLVLSTSMFEWISFSYMQVNFSFVVDSLSILMILVITGVGFLIHVYSIGYMHDDEGYNRFFSYMNLFVFFMLLLVMGDNYLVMFAGWEGVGLCSYLLIGFWFKNNEYNDAANKAFIMNRIGDLGFLLGLFFIFYLFGSFNYDVVFGSIATNQPSEAMVTTICLLLFVGAIGKSAQLPLYTWLPDAMAGPTPVSALIHAATMVTAGVYLVVRNAALFSLSPITMSIIASIGIVTSLFAASIALKQNDIKKILAYSTVSQLGLMFFAAGLGVFTASMFHLTTHAFFKALLFLSAGSVIHALHGEQDIRQMGGLKKKIPITFLCFLIGTIAIAGIPPFSGFFSKDEILAAAFHQSPLLWGLGIVVSAFTAFYMFRLFFLTFMGAYRGDSHKYEHAHESPASMYVPLIVLSILSVFGGLLNVPGALGGHHALKSFLGIATEYSFEANHKLEYILMGLTTLMIVAIIFFAYKKYVRNTYKATEATGFAKVLANKYYLDEGYEVIIVKPIKKLSSWFSNVFDNKIIDAMVNGTGKLLQSASGYLRFIQNGQISFYLLMMVVGLILILSLNIL